VAPLEVKIGGVVCPGTALIQQGTLVTGLAIPQNPQGGKGLPIEITTGALPDEPLTLAQTFTYTTKKKEENGCAAAQTGGRFALLAALAALAAASTATTGRRPRHRTPRP
jgi:hypothetical protein